MILYFLLMTRQSQVTSSTNDEKIKDIKQKLSDKYFEQFDKFKNQGEKYQAIIWSLTELATLIDNAATKYEIEYEIGGHLNSILNSVDIRDREMKKQFRDLQKEVDSLKSQIDSMVSETKREIQKSMRNIRKDIVKSLRDIVNKSIDTNRNVAAKVQKNVMNSVNSYKKESTFQAIVYFVCFQILIFICIFFYSKYIQNQ